jgi:hypothetical protein
MPPYYCAMPTHCRRSSSSVAALLQLCCSWRCRSMPPYYCAMPTHCRRCCSSVAALLQLCCSSVVALLQLCCSSVAALLQLCCGSVAALLRYAYSLYTSTFSIPRTTYSQCLSRRLELLARSRAAHTYCTTLKALLTLLLGRYSQGAS